MNSVFSCCPNISPIYRPCSGHNQPGDDEERKKDCCCGTRKDQWMDSLLLSREMSTVRDRGDIKEGVPDYLWECALAYFFSFLRSLVCPKENYRVSPLEEKGLSDHTVKQGYLDVYNSCFRQQDNGRPMICYRGNAGKLTNVSRRNKMERLPRLQSQQVCK